MKVRGKWLVFWSAILVALITGIFAFFQRTGSSPSTTITQKNDSGTNNSALRDINQNGQDVINGKNVTVDKGDTYNVTSNDQKGGITAGKVIIIKNIQFLRVNNQTVKVNIKDNFTCEIDTANNIIRINPKTGSWMNTFLGLSVSEMKSVRPHFRSKSGSIPAMSKNLYQLQADSVYAMTSTGNPSTNDFYYTMHYESLPTYIIFGNYPQPLYKVNLSATLKH